MEHQHSSHHDQHENHDHSSKKQKNHHRKEGHQEQGEHHHDHGDHHGHMISDFKRRFWVSLILTLPVLLLSQMVQEWLGIKWEFTGDRYVLFAISSVIYFYGGWPFLSGLKGELAKGKPAMMTLIALAITVAYVYSSAVVFGLAGMGFFWELATLIDLMLLGHWIEMKSVMGASKALDELAKLMPSEAHKILEDGSTEEVKITELEKGDKVLVKPGEKIPADGKVLDGNSYINEAMLTGESKPVQKQKGQKVIGGSVNERGALQVEVEHTGKEAYLSRVIDMVGAAQETKSKTQNLANKAAGWLFYIALIAGLGTLAAWMFMGEAFDFALERMVTVMIISCPHALGLAIPLVAAISTSASARVGLLIRNRTAFEKARNITLMVFDKTGTLTKGSFGVTRFESVDQDLNKNDILKIAGAVESQSEHPIANGIIKKLKEKDLEIGSAKDYENISGEGVKATWEGKNVKIVSPGYLKKEKLELPEGAFESEKETVVFLLMEGKVAGYIALADEIREDSYEAVETLKKEGIKVVMATGDNEDVAKAVSESLDLDGYYSEVLPEEKQELVKKAQKEGEIVAMTGDGVNDAPALAQADIGIAVGSGTDVAAETADIVLVHSNPKDIAALILFGKATYSKMVQNLIWATAYNAVALPLATGFVSGWVISPAMGAVFMSLSTIIVALNAQLLKRKLKLQNS
ncbi:copper-translocating P-type ATPase [Echinicola jeungdonensis]|uniref:Copper-translocating P-type ATPase n=1 Tax=Echinicola jeungdonensis TaxID=709343 RepID=A0ABV5J8Z5_9BACT|nr:copper-translocating P-type ATPase [Echinicola jeungdonensis]MDN3670196.1 copper-translocating P-type ATPase [Echinicola jeungdonensis]